MGPTGSGKTDLAMRIADHFPVHIISVDSAMVYRAMNIGTAKPDAEELKKYPHALIDVCDPEQSYSVAQFLEDAKQEIKVALEKGKTPLLVGGTMLYFKALLEGLADLPKADAAIRAEIGKQAETHGWAALHRELQKVDPRTAARLHPNHSARIQRALEVWRQTGVPLSVWHQRDHGKAGIEDLVTPLALAILPEDRQSLHLRIKERLDAMLAAGFVDEVRQLRNRPGMHGDLPSIRAVGYRQIWQYLEGELSEGEMQQAVLAATRQLAKRQVTWLRSWPNLLPINPLDNASNWRSNKDIFKDSLKFL